MKKIFPSLFSYGKTAQFLSSLSPEVAAKKLDERARRQNLLTLVGSVVPDSTMFGWANKKEVILHRIRPFIGNSFKPYFKGKFINTDKGSLLEGVFTMNRFTKVFISAVFISLIIVEILVILTFFIDPSQKAVALKAMLVYMPGFALLVFGVVFLGRFFARKDVEWISNEIRDALK